MPATGHNDALRFKIKDLRHARGDRRRLQVLEAAIDLMAQGEVASLNLERIAKLCKVRRSHVAYYFSEPSVLIRAAIEHAMSFGQEFAVEKISLATTAKERLKAFVEANFEWFKAYPQHASVFGLLNYYAICDESYRKLNEALADMAEKRIEAILLGGNLRAGRKKEAKQIAANIRALLVGSLARLFSSDLRSLSSSEKEKILQSIFQLAERVWEK